MTLDWQVRGEKRASFIALFGVDRKLAIKFILLFDLTNLAFFKVIRVASREILYPNIQSSSEISDFR